jgi:hypothetical protein
MKFAGFLAAELAEGRYLVIPPRQWLNFGNGYQIPWKIRCLSLSHACGCGSLRNSPSGPTISESLSPAFKQGKPSCDACLLVCWRHNAPGSIVRSTPLKMSLACTAEQIYIAAGKTDGRLHSRARLTAVKTNGYIQISMIIDDLLSPYLIPFFQSGRENRRQSADGLRTQLVNLVFSLSAEALVRNAYWQTHSNISRLDAKIDELLLRRRCLRIYRHLLSTLLSPVRFLPPELLGEIFRYCLPQDYDESGARKAVMLPSHVCKRWRDVALSTPALWTNIVLHVTDKTLESQTALVTDWVSRSGNLPLSFTLQGQENVLPIMAVLFQHCARWQHINLSVSLETLQCLEAANGRLQRLETLGINGCDSLSWVEQILESAPRLRKVSVSRKFSGMALMVHGLSSWS